MSQTDPTNRKTTIRKMPSITIYTDGSSLGNPGPGGYGVVLLSGPNRTQLTRCFRLTTNNRM